jgi:hypothetical protein
MSPLRIGLIILVIGISLFFATNLRAKPIKIGVGVEGGPAAFGPYLLEPRQTIIVLLSAGSDNVTIHVVPAKSWTATQNITLANPIFSAQGMRRLYTVTFQPGTRGIYYFIVTTSDGKLLDEAEIKFEQTGLAQDLYLISIAAVVVGTVIMACHGVNLLWKHKKQQFITQKTKVNVEFKENFK